MEKTLRSEIIRFIEPQIVEFHKRRIDSLLQLKLQKILSRKNPYLFRAKNLNTAHDLVKAILDAHLSSQEEGLFGGILEQLAVFICSKVYGGKKSSAEGIDLELEKDGTYYLVSIKSGPNWGNSQQVRKMGDNFKRAIKIRRTNTQGNRTVAANGCCYGKEKQCDKGDYIKLCGQEFWDFVSGDANLYTDIVEPFGHRAKEKNEQFHDEYAKVINKLTMEFGQKYCAHDGSIRWVELVQFNSSSSSKYKQYL